MLWRTMAERTEISLQEARTFLALKGRPKSWLSNIEIAELVDGVSPRSIRAYTLKFVRLGLLDQVELFPRHKYRLAERPEKRNRSYWQRLLAAIEIFGLEHQGDHA